MNLITLKSINQKTIQGIDKYFAGMDDMPIGGDTYSTTTLKAVFQAEIDADAAIEGARAQLKQRVVEAQTVRTKARATRAALKSYIVGTKGAKAISMLEDFGVTAPKPKGVRSVESKANAILRAQATRMARGTMSKRKKLAIKGVPRMVVVLTADEATPAPKANDAVQAAPNASVPASTSPDAPSHS